MIRLSSLITISDTIKIEHELGSGGSGAVYKAWHSRLKKHVVVKEVRHCPAESMEVRRNEAEALKNVKSLYLPQVFDFLVEGDRAYTVMEYIEGESFDKLLVRGEGFTTPRIIKWYEQLALALEEIHRHDICHRDVKPANIMLTPEDDVRLVDFSAALIRGNESGLISRSLGYASPEQYEAYRSKAAELQNRQVNQATPDFGRDLPIYEETQSQDYDSGTDYIDEYSAGNDNRNVSDATGYNADRGGKTPATSRIDWKRSDIYSLGATMYHISTGIRPPIGADEAATPVMEAPVPGLVAKTLAGTARPDESIAFIIEKSMRYDPSERYGSAFEIIAELQGAQGSSGSQINQVGQVNRISLTGRNDDHSPRDIGAHKTRDYHKPFITKRQAQKAAVAAAAIISVIAIVALVYRRK